MNSVSILSGRSTAAVAILVSCLLAPKLCAQWGSIRGNNRERVQPRREEHAPEIRREPARAPEIRREAVRVPEVHREIERLPRQEPVHWDWNAYRHEGYYWSGYHPGMVLRGLPQGYVNLALGGRPYYYYQGVYYQPGQSGYVVVTPTSGVIVPTLPPGAQATAINGTLYYYAGGAFYIQQPTGFLVVPPPLGVTVATLPPNAAPVTINGNLYYMADSVYYLPVMQGGVTMYTVVQP